MLHTIIVEDDPMVAQINQQYFQQMEDIEVDAVFGNGQAAWEYLQANPVDLAILDVYMPGLSGTELLRLIRDRNLKCAVIMVTAASEMSVVDKALRLGVVDYLIKPFSFPRLQEAIQRCRSKMELLNSREAADQGMVDCLFHGEPLSTTMDHSNLQKGLNPKTLAYIYSYIKEHTPERHTCESLSAASGLSKVTIRRYLNYLVETGQLLSSIDYETGGRPRVLYRLK
ncbi:MAG: response regulator [Oscillibacter sp.]|nr:response regulator [Oscillibacter sp.]